MVEDFLKNIDHGDYISDYWLFEDEYIKEIRYKGDDVKTYIIEIPKFIEENPDHLIISDIKEYKEI